MFAEILARVVRSIARNERVLADLNRQVELVKPGPLKARLVAHQTRVTLELRRLASEKAELEELVGRSPELPLETAPKASSSKR